MQRRCTAAFTCSIGKFVKTARPYHTIEIEAGRHHHCRRPRQALEASTGRAEVRTSLSQLGGSR